jgi:hypothetical protein
VHEAFSLKLIVYEDLILSGQSQFASEMKEGKNKKKQV